MILCAESISVSETGRERVERTTVRERSGDVSRPGIDSAIKDKYD